MHVQRKGQQSDMVMAKLVERQLKLLSFLTNPKAPISETEDTLSESHSAIWRVTPDAGHDGEDRGGG